MPNPMSQARLHLITDRTICRDISLEEAVAQAIEGGVEVVHLREKDLPSGEFYQLAVKLRHLTYGKANLIINERIDIATAISADGVHLPGNSVPMYVAKKIGGQMLSVGRSVHSVEEAINAQDEEADYLMLGTIYKTASHPGKAPDGPEMIQRVKEAVTIPVFAIGGIDASNVAEVMAAGADGVAVIRAILAASDIKAAATELVEAIKATAQQSHVS